MDFDAEQRSQQQRGGASTAAHPTNGGPRTGNGVETTLGTATAPGPAVDAPADGVSTVAEAPAPVENRVLVIPAQPAPPVTIPARRERRLTVEHALYGLLLIAAALTRFWDLASRAFHHDESLHAYYSWQYAIGDGYVHDPLMHGPFLFHANALVYLLLGASDAASRYMPAIFGVVLVGMPYLLRGPRFLGRWGALIASVLLLVSPTFLYYSRYIRHDIYTIVGTLLLFVCVVRYLERPERRWLITGGVTIAFLLTNHEIVFAVVLCFVLFLGAALLWNRLRPLAIPTVVTAIFAVLLVRLLPDTLDRPLPAIPWNNPTQEQAQRFYRDLATHPLVIALVLLGVAYLLLARTILARMRDPDRRDEGWLPSLFAGAPTGSVERAVHNAGTDRRGLLAALGAGAAIFVLLFTSLFANINGLATSTFATNGTLLYWLGQHNVQRGEQPWFYFLLLMPQYELFAVLFGVAAAVLTVWRARRVWRVWPTSPLRFQLFLVFWFVFILGVLSWAGEKMPWLVTHIALPATLLAATLLGELVERTVAARQARADTPATAAIPARVGWAGPGLVAGLLIAAACWFFLAGWLTLGRFEETDGAWRRVVPTAAADRWWLLALPLVAALVLVTASWLMRGGMRTGRAALVALVAGLLLLQVHAGWRMSYSEGDVPRDMLVYVQTSPDVTRFMRELDRVSAETTGGKGMEVWYDGKVSWPMQWYLRDYPNKHFFGSSLSAPPEDAPVLLVSNENNGGVAPHMDGYTAQEYVLRWWFPEEEIYRRFAIAPELNPGRSAWKKSSDPHGPIAIAGSVIDAFETQLTQSGEQRVYRLLMYRDLPAANGQFNFQVYIRNDLLPFWNDVRY